MGSEGGLLKSQTSPILVEDYILTARTSSRVTPQVAAEALKTPVIKTPETPKSTKTIFETPTTSAKKTSRDYKTPAKLTWSARGLLTPSPKTSEKPLQFTPAKATPEKVATPKAAT